MFLPQELKDQRPQPFSLKTKWANDNDPRIYHYPVCVE